MLVVRKPAVSSGHSVHTAPFGHGDRAVSHDVSVREPTTGESGKGTRLPVFTLEKLWKVPE